jgi:hypothetical protein
VRRGVALAAAAAALALVPSTSLAARGVTFGSTLLKPPTDYDPAATCDTTGANSDTGACTRVAVRFDGTGAVKGRIRAPRSGVIRRIRIRAAAPAPVRVKLARVQRLDFDEAEGDARSPSRGRLLRLKGRGLAAKKAIESFKVKLRVRKGDYLALQSSTTTAMTCQPVSDFQQLLFQPVLDPGGPFQSSAGHDDCTLLVQATIKRR